MSSSVGAGKLQCFLTEIDCTLAVLAVKVRRVISCNYSGLLFIV